MPTSVVDPDVRAATVGVDIRVSVVAKDVRHTEISDDRTAVVDIDSLNP